MSQEIIRTPTFGNKNYGSLTEKEKLRMIKKAAKHYEKYMRTLGIDLDNDPHSKDTPMRVAKAFVNELAIGRYSAPPKITDFDNDCNYDGMVCQTNIEVVSFCSHHHLSFTGKAHVAYIPDASGKVVGLSKLNRIVDYYARRPQVQESLTMQIHEHINTMVPGNLGVAIVLECSHLCTCVRGIGHDSIMKTSKLSGVFMDNTNLARKEFYDFILSLKK